MDDRSRLEDRLYRGFSRLVKVERHEVAPLGWAVLVYTLLLAGYYIVRPVRESFGLAGGTGNLPEMMIATVVSCAALNPVYATLVARFPRKRLLSWVYRGVIVCFLGFFVALRVFEGEATIWVGRVFYVFLSVVNLFLVSVFFSLLADLFDRRQAARLFGCIAAGGSLGGLLGSSITAVLVDELGPGGLLLLSCLFFEGALRVSRRVIASVQRAEEESTPAADSAPARSESAQAHHTVREGRAIGGSRWAAFTSVAHSPYLLGITAYVLFYGVSGTLAYFLQAEVVKVAADGDSDEATRIFASIDQYTNLAALFFQLYVAGRLLQRIGAGLTLAILPLYTAVGFLLLASGWVPAGSMLLVFGVFQVLRRALGYGLKRPAQEVLFTVLTPEDKYKAKNLVDLVGPRTGDVLGALTDKGLKAAGYGLAGLAATAVPISLLWVGAAIFLGVGFRRRAAAGSSDASTSKA